MRNNTILIIDDFADLRESLAVLLTQFGYEVSTAEDGQAALAKLESYTPCLILLDLMMPGMDGWSFRARLSSDARLRHIPVVILTAMDNVDPRSLQAEAVLVKPLDLRQVDDVARRYCERLPSHPAPPRR